MGMNGLSEDPIPEGIYCYTSDQSGFDARGHLAIKLCPYWKKLSGKYDARCEFLGKDDVDGTLLWDQVKICGVKDYMPDD